MRQILLPFFFAGFMLLACKTTQKLYDKGEYEKAFYAAIGDLKKNPNSSSAQNVLPDAYKQYQRKLEENISIAKAQPNQEDVLYENYAVLQQLYDAIQSTPAAQTLVRPKSYRLEMEQVAGNAAEIYYQKGLAALQLTDKKSAQDAYYYFEKANTYVPGYKDVAVQLRNVQELAMNNVIVNTIDQRFGYYQLDGSFMKNDIMQQLNNSVSRKSFNRFYEIYSANNIRADEYMDLNLYDIWIGQLNSNTYSYDVTKNISVPDTSKPGTNVSATIKATVMVTRRLIDSRAVMDCRITNAETRRIMYTERFPAQYTWEKQTGTYTGDSRALGDKDWAIIRNVFNNSPNPNELYRELTRKILIDYGNRMRQIYK